MELPTLTRRGTAMPAMIAITAAAITISMRVKPAGVCLDGFISGPLLSKHIARSEFLAIETCKLLLINDIYLNVGHQSSGHFQSSYTDLLQIVTIMEAGW